MNRKVPDLVTASPGFWQQSWQRFRRRKLAMFALYFIGLLSIVAIFSPAIAGTKPIVCRYKGEIYFPCLGYYNPSWENPIFQKDRFRRVYPRNLQRKDPDSWALWPLVYQDPHRPVRDGEWEGLEGNPFGAKGHPSGKNWFGTYKTGFDVFASMVHGTRIALLVGFVSTGIAAARNGGTVVCVGAPPMDQGIEMTPAALFTVSGKKLMGCVLGSVNSLHEIPRMIALWKAGRVDLESLITQRRPLAEINEAMDDLRANRGIRTVLSMG